MAEFTNEGLVSYCKSMLDYKSPYWYGTYGQIASEAVYLQKKEAYPEQYEKWSKASFAEQYGKKVHDCSGLIKGYFMTPHAVSYPTVEAKYDSKYDLSSSALEARAREKGPISTIPEIPGLIVWKSGHVGVYIGDGWVIEERGHQYGTVKTKLSERPWTKWLKHPYIIYKTEQKEETKPEPVVVKPEPVITPVPVKETYPLSNCVVTLPVLRRGMPPESIKRSVKRLQAILNILGYGLDVDGSFGPLTEAAVKKFQKSMGLKDDGIVGPATWTALIA